MNHALSPARRFLLDINIIERHQYWRRSPNHTLCIMTSIKGLSPSEVNYDGSQLRIAIVHARWNKVIIDSLVHGAVAKLKERGVKENNIIVQSVPGSFELPLACSKFVIHLHNTSDDSNLLVNAT